MPGFFKSIANFLVYKEPQNEEHGFELLENQNEGLDLNPEQQNPQQQNQDQTQPAMQQPNQRNSQQETEDKEKGNKLKLAAKPIKVEDWNERKKSESTLPPLQTPCQPPKDPDSVLPALCDNLAVIRQKFGLPKNQDVILREFSIGRKVKAFMTYIEGMVDKNTLNLSVFPQLMSRDVAEEMGEQCPVDFLIENVMTVYKLEKVKDYTRIISEILSGVSALFIDGCESCILLDTRGYEKRNVEQPITETVVKGSQEGFNENLRTNLTLVRRIVKNEKLVTELLPVGKMNNANCALMYIDGTANPQVVNEVKKRIQKINTDFIVGVGMVEQFIEDNPFMLFPLVLTTERPDRTASFLMEGQVVIITEGTPFAMTVPVSFFRLFHTSEDSFARWPFGTFLRLIRIVGLFCATLLPGLYVAIILFHPEAVPTELMTSIARAKESVPFPTVLEVLMLEVAFELIREGGVRVPSVIGQTLGIVGALILGQAAVAAGLVSPVLVIIVSVTALGNFAIPNYSLALAIRIERFFFIFAGATLGMLGITLMVFLLAVSACSAKSFGVPFFAPVAPRTRVNPDVIIRYPIWMQKNRPDAMNLPNRKRQGQNVKNWSHHKNQEDGNGGKGK